MTPTQTPPIATQTVDPPAPASGARTCAHCGSDKIRESSTRRGMDLLPANIGKVPYRCRACRGRFYMKRENEPENNGAPSRRRAERKREPLWKHPSIKRHFNEICIGVGSLLAFGVFLYLLARSGIAF